MEVGLSIAQMQRGMDVEGFYLLKAAFAKVTASGKPFLSAVLADTSGTIEAKVWDYSGPIGERDVGKVLKVRGSVSDYRACIAAFADSPYQVILSTGEQIDRSALGTLPDNITALPHVDQIAVLQKADVFLSHCGMNSASESLYFGVPLVLFPQTNEQGGVAARVAELGAGLKLEKADAASIRTAVDAVLQTPSYRANAQNIRESFLRCGGAKAAVDRILSVADRK